MKWKNPFFVNPAPREPTYSGTGVGPNRNGGLLTISSVLFGRQFTVIWHRLETNSTSRIPLICHSKYPSPLQENGRVRVKADVQATTREYGVSKMKLPGFVPAGVALLFQQNDPKPCWPWPAPASAGASSSGALRSSSTPAARKLVTLKQCAPFSRSQLHGSAMPRGQRA